MKISFTSFLLALLLVVMSPSCKDKNNDPDIQSAINSKTVSNPYLSNVSAYVNEGVVTLTGNCADEDCRTNAEKAIKDIEGVKNVINNINIAQVPVSSDDDLKQTVQKIIEEYDNVQAGINDGVITLRGQIDREDLQPLMMELNNLKVKRIDNQLIIK